MSKSEAVIIGGGIIGLSLADELLRHGYLVTVIEQHGEARGASIANAGWAETRTLQPLPAPSTLRFGISSLMKPSSPLYIKPRLSLSLAGWLLSFALQSTETRWKAGRAALQRLATSDEDGLEALLARVHAPIVSRSSLSVHSTSEAAVAEVEHLGISDDPTVEIVDQHALHELAPFLSDAAVSGVRIHGDVIVEPNVMMKRLRTDLSQRGVTFVNDSVIGFRVAERRIRAARGTKGDISGDVFLIAAGYESDRLLAELGVRLTQEAGKGYSVEIPLPFHPPTMVSLAEAKVGIAPAGNGARLVGTMELSGDNMQIKDQRIRGILDAAKPYIREFPSTALDPKNWNITLGKRAMTAHGLPVIDRAGSYDNIYVSTGHGMMGVSLATASAKKLVAFIEDKKKPEEIVPFPLKRNRFTHAPV